MYLRPLSIAILALGAVAAASDVLALGFGRMPQAIAFGQALDLTVPLRIEPGENQLPGCLQADVHVGEQRMAPGAVRVTLEQRGAARDGLRVRIRSAQAVQEPVVAVNLSVGCGGPVSRHFVVFADLPDTGVDAARVALADPTRGAVASAAPAAQAPQVPRRAPASGTAAAGPETVAATAPPPTRTKTARKAPADGVRDRNPAKARTPTLAARNEAPQRSPDAAAPRLKLEEPEELLQAAQRTVAAQDAAQAAAAQAASAAEAAASAAEQRLLVLETKLQTMRDEAGAHRAAMEQMRNRLAQAEDQGRMQSALAAIVVALGMLALWLAWHLRRLRQQQAAWWRGAEPAGAVSAVRSDAAREAASVKVLPPAPVPVPVGSDAAVPVIAPDTATAAPAHRTAGLSAPAPDEDVLSRPVSVDELIDLEQQAEFFTVLGEEDAAVALLMSHLRSTGGTSPLPYLKLLEIYRRRGDREAYERMRKRFGQRFNAVAPGWDADPVQGRDLQDYPQVLSTLQASWHRPLDAIAELENLLFRKRNGELFELPAYRDVLTLYSVARDLHRQEDQPGADVDVLLPLGAGDANGLGASASLFDSLGSGLGAAQTVPDDRPTAPIDLDLSEPVALHDERVGGASPVRASLRQPF